MDDRYLKYVKICERAEQLGIDEKNNRIQALMDIESADKKFNLKLDELLNTRIFDFAHDYCGIRNNINRNEFPATDFGLFVPRFASEKEKKMEFHVNLDFNMKMRPGEAEEEAENRFYETLYAAMCKDNDEFDFTICEQEAREIQK